MRCRAESPLGSSQNEGRECRGVVKRESGTVVGLLPGRSDPRVPKRLMSLGWPRTECGMPGRPRCGPHEKVPLGFSAPPGCRSSNGLQMI